MAKKNKVVKQKEIASNSKIPKHVEDPESFYDKVPVWSFKLLDNNYDKWGFIHVDNINETIINKLKDYEGMTWDEIIKETGGKKHGNNNHYENISDLIPEAQNRWKELHLEEYDRIFSLRLTGLQRLYGILLNGVFKIVWFDPKHEIYKTQK